MIVGGGKPVTMYPLSVLEDDRMPRHPVELQIEKADFARHPNGNWLCTIDNSYGHELLLSRDA